MIDTDVVEVDRGVYLELATAGDVRAPTVLLVHGNGPNWRQFTPQLTSLADRWHVVAPSLRGHGHSTLPPEPERADLSVQRLAADLLALLDHLDVAVVHLVGNSVGGLVGFELARSAPQRLSTLTTFGTTAQLSASRMLTRSMTLLVRVVGTSGMGRLAGLAVKDRAVGREIAALMAMADPAGVRLLSENIATYDYTLTVASSQTPLLLVRGQHDHGINRNLDTTLAVLAGREDAEVVDLPGAGHFANLEQPDAFDAILRGFLDKHR